MSEAPAETRAADLREKLIRLHGDDGCTCRHAYKTLGRLYGISMGKDWVRLDTDPACPHHGKRGGVR